MTLQQALVHALWVGGLAGLMATASFAGWQRRDGGRYRRHAARLFVPTSLSLIAICTGALLNGFIHPDMTVWWERVAWGLLLFILILLLAADRISGWGRSGLGQDQAGIH